MTIRLNDEGLEALRDILTEHHKLGHDLTDEQLHAWASDAEDAFSDHGDAYIEIRSHDTISGHVEIHTLPEDAVECSTALKISARHGHDGSRWWYDDCIAAVVRRHLQGGAEKWVFSDGSAVVMLGEGFWIAFSDHPDCFCTEEDGEHDDDCPRLCLC